MVAPYGQLVFIRPVAGQLLNELAERPDGALVTELPRQPGSRENRWMHLLSGAPAVQSSSAAGLAAESPSLGISELGSLYLGGVAARDLAAAGRITAHTPGAVVRADAFFRWPVAPFCVTRF